MKTLAELQALYVQQFKKVVPPAYRNKAEWIASKLNLPNEETQKQQEQVEEVAPKIKIKETVVEVKDLNPLKITFRGQIGRKGYDIMTDGRVWKVIPIGGNFWTTPPIYKGTKEGAQQVYDSL